MLVAGERESVSCLYLLTANILNLIVQGYIMITQAELHFAVNYNPETGIFTWKTPRKKVIVGTQAGSLDKEGYIILTINQISYRAHRLAWLYIHGEWPKFIDHINEIKHDNRICNLRNVTHSENMQNKSKPQSNNTTGYIGVSFNKKRKHYTAVIKINGKTHYLGSFKTAEEANEARQKAKLIYHKY